MFIDNTLNRLKQDYPEKFVPEETIFSHIHPGDRIFIGTGCGEPQYLVRVMTDYVKSHPRAFFDAEVLQIWNLGVSPYTDEKLKGFFRYNSFFIGRNIRDAVNEGLADYTPIFLSAVPALFSSGVVPIDVALIQTSLPDAYGYVSLGISVDIVKAAAGNASITVAQINSNMPRVLGDTFIHIKDIDFLIPRDEPLLVFESSVADDIGERIGRYVSRIIQDGDTIQVGYGSVPDAVLKHLGDKRDLGIHTELFTDGIVDLIRKGVITNSKKMTDCGKTVAAFCMGKKSTYDFLNDNPGIEFKPVDYTNNPLIIARNRNVTAINSGLEIDLTGQATAESIGKVFYSGIGGQADFMRGAVLSRGGKTILILQSTAEGGRASRIVPILREGTGVTLTRGDVQYVVTEYGIAYLHGKNIRERAMSLIAIAHPEFREWLIEEAKGRNLIYRDQAFIQGKKGEYPEDLEAYRTTKTGLKIFLRPVKIDDEDLLKEFFYKLSSDGMYYRFISLRPDMHHDRLQKFVVIDYTKEMMILAVIKSMEKEIIIGIGQYLIDETSHMAEVAFVVRDDYQKRGVGSELLSYLTYLAKKNGLHGFTAEVLVDNRAMLSLFDKTGFVIEKRADEGVYELKMSFRE
jgi:acyl-CoA hydrolase/RimJ/RimL family protein N-acetyltransferase